MPTEEIQPLEVDPADIAKGSGIGLVKGAADAAGAMGTFRGYAAAGLDHLVSPETAQTIKDRAYQIAGLTPLGTVMRDAPSSDDIQNQIQGVTGAFYQPRTDIGKFAQTLGERVPVAFIPGGSGRAPIQAIISALRGLR